MGEKWVQIGKLGIKPVGT